jgi:malonyl-CoA O-methyltransferase
MDAHAARRWLAQVPQRSPWLHEEVARRMVQRLQWMRQRPASWLSWQPLLGGLLGHQAVVAQYPESQVRVFESHAAAQQRSRQILRAPWWQRWRKPAPHFEPVAPASVDMVWANMVLHMSPEPRALLQAWHRALSEQGFVMFSCLGPDTARELRAVYAEQGWAPAGHDFTDMHDWGDMLVEAGFAEPVMDMERITLTYSSAAALLEEWRGWGCNLHPARFPGLRGRHWRQALEQALDKALRRPEHPERLALTVELIFGHALKPQARLDVAPELVISLDQMRQD